MTRLLDLVRQRLDGAGGDRPLLAGLANAGDDFGAVESLAPAVLLQQDDATQLDALQRREAAAAGEALAAATDAVLLRTGVRNLGLVVGAERAVHGKC